jgi:diguanylate cyclase (GGDEF)-like protein
VKRPPGATSPGGVLRLFLVFAVASLVPVLVLGLVLASSYRSDAAARGIAEARAQAALFAHIAVEPLLAGADLSRPLTPEDVAGLDQMSGSAADGGEIVRLRLRDLSGHIVYSSDGSGKVEEVDDEALEAAEGAIVAEVTHLDADDKGGGSDDGILAAEVYRPLTDGASTTPIGVLELYLPYDPIAQDVEAGLNSLYRDLAVGLTLLYVLLAGISYSATRRLRAQVARNAFLAEHDLLTGLPNRTAFQKRLEEVIGADVHGGPAVAVAVLDLDRFKEVNETLGHGNGDALLRHLGRRLSAAVGEQDFVARLGGDEFGVILVSSDAAPLTETVALVQQALAQEVELAGLPLVVEASMGIALAPLDGRDAETLLQHADVAMYVAKQTGSGVAHYHKELDQYDAARLVLVGDMRRALAGDELVLHYQPKLDLRTGEVDAVEALVRWNHPERGLLMPDTFLPVVEKTGMIDPMTAWIVNAALKWLVSSSQPRTSVRVAVNISARNLVLATFPEMVLAALSRHGVSADRLTIEVTETALVADLQRAELSLRRLAAAGVRVSVDDFGRGQTSLSYLSTLPLYEVKIDRSFVTDMGEVESHAAIVRSVVDLAHNLGFEVVAEGVETEPVLDALRAAGCDIAQGYHIARPMPAEQADEWLLAHDLPRPALGRP